MLIPPVLKLPATLTVCGYGELNTIGKLVGDETVIDGVGVDGGTVEKIVISDALKMFT
ncbi:MAG: hypothetical protein IPL53_00160 [Ignavibacteria bacterium]|nr:hypothetical protein [Ignavibacteria bacterium]